VNIYYNYRVISEIEEINLGLFRRDSLGYAISIDLLLAIIPLTILLGVVSADMDNLIYKMEDTVFRGSMDRVASDAITTLVQTPGDPQNWDETGNPLVPGLAEYDSRGGVSQGRISNSKMVALSNNDVQNLVGNEYGVYFNMSTTNNQTLKTVGTYNTSAKDIVRVERVGLYSKFKIVSSAVDLIRYTGTPRVYTSPPDPFPTNTYYLNIYDYFVIVVNRGYSSATVNVNNERVIFPQNFTGGTRYANITNYINPTILKNTTAFSDNVVDVRGTGSPGDSMDVYIIQVPKGTPIGDVNVQGAAPIKARVQLYLWLK
jgi:hypothetical protein